MHEYRWLLNGLGWVAGAPDLYPTDLGEGNPDPDSIDLLTTPWEEVLKRMRNTDA